MNFTFEEFNSSKKAVSRTSAPKVKYFTLENDGDAAIVRFDYESVKDIKLSAVHPVEIKKADGTKFYRDISCSRKFKEEIDKCPLCAAGQKLINRFYVKLVVYEKDVSGAVIPVAKIWKRPAGFSNDLASLIDEYGNLKDCIFKIKRRGVKGSKDTRYDVLPVSADIYKLETGYVKDFSGFDNFNLEGAVYSVKTEEEMKEFLKTGSFPFIPSKTTKTETVAPDTLTEVVVESAPVETIATPVAETSDVVQESVAEEPKAEQSESTRPQRYAFF